MSEFNWLKCSILAQHKEENAFSGARNLTVPSYSEGYLRSRLREGVAVFINQLLDFVDRQTDDSAQEQVTKNEQFFIRVYELLFSMSPSIVDSLHTKQYFQVMSRTERLPEARRFFGANTYGDFVNRFAFGDEKLVEHIIEYSNTLHTTDIIDLIEQCKKIASYALGMGEWAEPCVGRMYRIVQEVGDRSSSSIVRDIAEDILRRIRTAWEAEAPGLIQTNADRVWWNGVQSEDRGLRQQFTADTPEPETVCMNKIASDALCFMERSGLSLQVALLDTAAPRIDELGRTRKVVHFQRWRELLRDSSVNPFHNDEQQDNLSLLLQDLLRPEVRAKRESDLGIRFRDIPLRSQIQLLRFLADQDATGYKRLRDTLHALPDAAPDIAHSFLAFAEHPELGTTVLATAELLRDDSKAAKELFGAYAAFARSVDWEANQILGVGANALRERMPERSALLRHLLHRANHLFAQAEQELAIAEGEERSKRASALTTAFQREGFALRRQVAAFEDIADTLARATNAEMKDQYRTRLAAAFRELVLGERPYQLPETFFDEAERAAANLAPERLPEDKPLYFPVGISRDLPLWQKVWEGKAEAAKPIDLYAWLFWLQNQGKSVELVIADEPQAENFLRQYPDRLGTMPEEQRAAALAFAHKIGDAEQATYARIIETFGLTNITIRRFAEIRDSHREQFEQYQALCTRLADHPMWKQAFLSMVKESVVKDAPPAERRKAVSYAVEELAHILSVRGTKISHEGEAPYDAIAAVLWNVEDYAQQHGLELKDIANNEKLTPAINTVLDALQDRCNTGKSRATRDQPQFVYLEQFRQNLHRILKTAGVINVAGISARSVAFPFACPETGSQSFGWRGKGVTGEEVVVRFKEPYSTYFQEKKSALTLESDQIIALPNGDIAGKILALPQEQQRHYAERVLKPLLAHFYNVLEHTPNTYGYRLGLPFMNPADIKAEFRAATSLYELIEKIQEYIVVPASREHPASIII